MIPLIMSLIVCLKTHFICTTTKNRCRLLSQSEFSFCYSLWRRERGTFDANKIECSHMSHIVCPLVAQPPLWRRPNWKQIPSPSEIRTFRINTTRIALHSIQLSFRPVLDRSQFGIAVGLLVRGILKQISRTISSGKAKQCNQTTGRTLNSSVKCRRKRSFSTFAINSQSRTHLLLLPCPSELKISLKFLGWSST